MVGDSPFALSVNIKETSLLIVRRISNASVGAAAMNFVGIFILISCFLSITVTSPIVDEDDDSTFGCNCLDDRQHERRTMKKQYFVHNNQEVTFLEAWRRCLSVGHQLATITSEKDSQLIEQAIAKSSNTKGPWYIAGTDLGSEGHFVWISTNKPVGYLTGYLNYSPGQPDNAGGNENCLEIGRWGGVVWNDVPCEWKQRYICEYVTWN
ncbi:perlucin-like [Sabethes cyaneus]|uniref:perlucin-like n=1 Tax=Sabethes cyaneus TaxID=53552 RepID=UPI00237D450F|nr:perlucin-like [Sabethes cyaneus]